MADAANNVNPEPLLPLRSWVVYQDLTVRHVYTGIRATTREEALEKWRQGEGDIEPDREQRLDPVFDAVDVKE